VVVDDGSADPGEVARLARRAGARLVRHEQARGPAAARNSGLSVAATPLVCFVDSDVVPETGWLAGLRRHFDDPAVAAVAPRVVALDDDARGGWVSRYEAARSSLDMGPVAAAVRPHGRVPYVPGATLLARHTLLGEGFDEAMTVAEDVDLVWRLVARGWRVRYEPAALVRHDHRTGATSWLARRAFYGTGAAPLARRHGGSAAPMVLTSWTAALSGVVLAQRRWSAPAAGLLCGMATARTAYRMHGDAAAWRTAATATGIGIGAVGRQTAAALTRHYWPLTVALAVVSRRARRALLVAAVAEGLADHRRARPALDPVRHLMARRLDDLAYGTGLWWGAARGRSVRALLPRWRIRTPAPPDPPAGRHRDVPEPVVRDGR
ncbi:MAG: mycofactocin biosynthesis glycosyltransferase MftF, partial [Marmoricola sp.]